MVSITVSSSTRSDINYTGMLAFIYQDMINVITHLLIRSPSILMLMKTFTQPPSWRITLFGYSRYS